MRVKAVVVLALLAVAACQNPRLTYVTAEKNFKTAVAFAVAQRQSGGMSDEAYRKINPAIQAGNEALKNWLDMILKTPQGEKPDIPKTIYLIVMDTLDILEAYFLQEQR